MPSDANVPYNSCIIVKSAYTCTPSLSVKDVVEMTVQLLGAIMVISYTIKVLKLISTRRKLTISLFKLYFDNYDIMSILFYNTKTIIIVR